MRCDSRSRPRYRPPARSNKRHQKHNPDRQKDHDEQSEKHDKYRGLISRGGHLRHISPSEGAQAAFRTGYHRCIGPRSYFAGLCLGPRAVRGRRELRQRAPLYHSLVPKNRILLEPRGAYAITHLTACCGSIDFTSPREINSSISRSATAISFGEHENRRGDARPGGGFRWLRIFHRATYFTLDRFG